MQRTFAVLSKKIRPTVGSITRPANTTAYTAGDAVSDATGDAHLTFTNTVQMPLSATIDSVVVSSSNAAGTLPDLELYLFRKDITVIADNAAFTVSDAEALTCIGVIDLPVADWKDMAASSVISVNSIGLDFRAGQEGAANSTIYGQLVVRNAYVPASGEVFNVELVIAQH